MMSLIGGQIETHQEELKLHQEKWNPYVEVLHSKDYGNLKRRSVDGDSFSNKKKTIELCINSLSSEMKEKYQDFALFVEDVNIKTKVLEILWRLPEQEVREIMDDFHKKSLIVRKFNPTQDSYVYGIHDLLLYHIKKQLDDKNLQELHLKLIKCYEDYCGGDLSKLPRDDNYIFYYIGYHIANAKLYDRFTQWYFNLDFIEGKLKVAGPGDLLLDYKRYSSHFIEGSKWDAAKMRTKLSDFERFVELSGYDLKRDSSLDIVQLGLQEPHESEVYRTAQRCVGSRKHNTYLRFQLGPSKSRNAPLNIPVKDKISCACFSKESNDLIVAYESGSIQLMSTKGYMSRSYEGHTKAVKMMSVFPKNNVFLSVAEDCVKIWRLPQLDSTSPEPEVRTPSPSQRQMDFTDIFNKRAAENRDSWHTLNSHKEPIVWACFSSDGNKIATCSTKEGKVDVWGINSKEKFILTCIKAFATSCIFSCDDTLLIIGCATSYIYIYNIEKRQYLNHSVDSYPILSLFTLLGNEPKERFGVLTKATLCVWEIGNTAIHNIEKTKTHHYLQTSTGENESYVCCTAAPDGSVVAVAKSSGRIEMYDPNDGSTLREINDSSGNIKYLAMRECKEQHLLLGSYSETLKLWTLGTTVKGKQATMKPNFAITWTNNHKPILVAPTSDNCIQRDLENIITEYLMVDTDSPTDLCAVSKCGRFVAANTKNRRVYIHQDGPSCPSGFMAYILTSNKEAILQLKIELLQGHILVAIGCKQSIIVWINKEENGFNTILSKKVTLSVKLDRVDNYFILSNEELLVISHSGSIEKWCLNTSKPVKTLRKARLDVAVGPSEIKDSHLVVLTSQNISVGTFKWFLHSYNLNTESESSSFELESRPTCCSFSENGQRLAIGFENGNVQVYSCDTWSVTRELEMAKSRIVSVCMSTEGLVCAATEARVILHTVTGGQGQAKLCVKRLVMSPDNRTIITVDIHGHLHLIDELNPAQANFALAHPKPKKHSLSLP